MDTTTPLSIICFAIGAAMLLFALMTYRGELGLIRTIRFKMVKVEDEKEYGKYLGKIFAKVALAFIVIGLILLFL